METEKYKEERVAVARKTMPSDGIDVDDTYWNHWKTTLLIIGTLSLYFCDSLALVGGSVFARSITGVVGGETLSSWPALICTIMTVALVPPTAQAADYWGRKIFLVGPNIFGFVGSIVVARANNFSTVIGGYIILGIAFASNSLYTTVVSEVLPRKYRSYGQAAANLAVSTGAIFSLTVGGYLIKIDPLNGFRNYFYITAALWGAGTIMCALLYNSVPRELEVSLTFRQKLRALDWAGYFLFGTGTVLFCLGLSWAQNPYSWKNAHVLAPLLIGCALLCGLGAYSWKLKKDGLFHHGLFRDRNMVISLIAVFIEGMAFLASAVYFPFSLSVLHGSTMSPFRQAVCYMLAWVMFALFTFVTAIYIWWTKDLRFSGMFTFMSFAAFFIAMATITPETPERNFWGYVLFYGIGLGVCLTTFVTAAQFATDPNLISTTSGIVLAVRSLGGSVGLAIFQAIFNSRLTANLGPKVIAAATPLGLHSKEIEPLIEALTAGDVTLASSIPGASPAIIEAAGFAIMQAYVLAFRGVFICGAVFAALGIIAAAFLHNPHSAFTATIDAPIDSVPLHHDKKTATSEEQG